MTLSELTLVATFEAGGFPEFMAESMAAIAMRESGGDPSKHNLNPSTGDDSYGLVQINWADPDIKEYLQAKGITDPNVLLDPATNAKMAFELWRWKYSYMDLLWYTQRTGVDRQIYEMNLLIVHDAVLKALTPPGATT